MDIPKSLYRFFKKKEHRDQFFSGLIRFRYIEEYQKIADQARKDPNEGKGAVGKYRTNVQTLTIDKNIGKVIGNEFKPGDMSISGESLDKHFICSFSDKNVDLKKAYEEFGKYGVKITDVQKLLDLLNKNCKFDWKVGRIILKKVKYDKGDYVPMDENNTLPYGYLFAQKSVGYSDQCEWRVVLIGDAIKVIDKKPITIDIGSIKNIASSMDL